MKSESATTSTTDPLAVALLPVLLHKLAGATQLLSGLNALLSIEGGEDFALSRNDDLGAASCTAHDLGWLMAVLASAGGANLLQERREPRGLAIVLKVLAESLSRAGRTLHATGSAPPPLAPHVLDGWQVPWSVGTMLHAAASDVPEGSVLEWSLAHDGGELLIESTAGSEVERIAPLVRERVPGARLVVAGGRFTLAMPGAWFGDVPER